MKDDMPSREQTEYYKAKFGEKEWLAMQSERKRTYYREHPEKQKKMNAKWNKKNRKKYMREYRKRNKL